MAEDDVACILSDNQQYEPERGEDGDDVNILAAASSQESPANRSNSNDDDDVLEPLQDTETHDEVPLLAAEQTREAGSSRSGSGSRSSSRSRSRRHRHRRHHRRRPQFPGLKGKETNFIAAVCSMIVMVAVCTALVEPQWFMVYGGGCRDGEGNPISYIGMTEFIRTGHFRPVHHSDKQVNSHTKYIYEFGGAKEQTMYDCVKPRTVEVIHCILAFCFIIIALNLAAFLLDLAGPNNVGLKVLRRNAVFNVVAVLFCVLVNGLCFMVTEDLYSIQNDTKMHQSSRIEVQFSISYYLMAAAGAVSVIAAACNLFKTNIAHYEPRDVLTEDNNELDMGYDGPASAYLPPPPPPPYSP